MKNGLKLLFVMATVISISAGNGLEHGRTMAYASAGLTGADDREQRSAAVSKGYSEKFKAQFAYEMAQITAKIVSAPGANTESFKVEFAYATAQVTARVMPLMPVGQRKAFAYDMARITTKIISDPNLDVEEAKAEFAYEIAQITTKFITGEDNAVPVNKASLRDNAVLEAKPVVGVKRIDQKVNAGQDADIAPETYSALIDELMQVGAPGRKIDNKVNINGELRYHYALNNAGKASWDRDISGFRLYLGLDAGLYEDWRIYGRLEGKRNVINYDNSLDLSRLYIAGKLGTARLQAGSFGYLMAEGNIYDSGFDGLRADFAGLVSYAVSYGQTNQTKETAIATARYDDFDYNLEAGIYHYQEDDNRKNTIRAFGGNYNFSNFSIGAMALNSSRKDNKGNGNGYVFNLNYGGAKSWRPNTYGLFAKYYNQPRYTYIAHGMNGTAGWMDGFRGYGLGINYTLSENVVAGLEYYNLTEKGSGEAGQTWWSQLTQYF